MSKLKLSLGLLLLTLGALAVHGYHPYAEDAEIYLPSLEKILHPGLFPTGTEFFESHASLTFFPRLIAASVRWGHLPFDYALFIWQLASIFLLLLAAWELSGRWLDSGAGRWCAVALLAALLTLPVAGTALYIVDQYLNPRNLAAFAALFAVTRVLQGKFLRAILWLAFAAIVHPLMAFYALSFCALLVILKAFDKTEPGKFQKPEAALAVALLPSLHDFFAPPTDAYREAMRFHPFHFLMRWQWYEWLGILGPIPILWLFGRFAARRQLRDLALLCRALVIYDLIYFAIALMVAIPERFEPLARIQPLRNLHLLYVIMILIVGGFLGKYVLKTHIWRWVALFLPLCAGMFLAQRALFPASGQIEWPWAAPKNQWEQAFVWIRDNTLTDATFAIDPLYMRIPGEDAMGFRARAERSRLADALKDSGAVSMFPPLAEEWLEQFNAQKNWKQFSAADFHQLREKYGVDWVVLQAPAVPGLSCPYQNPAVAVCQIAAE